MARYALLLRGVNVGKDNKLPMVELRAMLEHAGCIDVETYIQSGNAVFSCGEGKVALTTKIESALEQYMGRPIATTLRTSRQLEKIVADNPFATIADDPRKLTVTFLSRPASKRLLAAVPPDDFTPELYAAIGNEIYAWYPEGQGNSQLAVALAKVRWPGTATVRNWNTVLRLAAMLRGE
ncbi:MAG: DUF1697 domain-containing protein [Solirubrobacterales bacterium]